MATQFIQREGGRLAGTYNGTPMERFLRNCEFCAATGCVLWTGGTTQGRGHHQPYGSFWFDGRRWFAHRWAAKYIHGLNIDEKQVDHCCPLEVRPKPHTLCVQHLQALSPKRHREVTIARTFIHLQVGLIPYEDIYGPEPEPVETIPFFTPPAWYSRGVQNDRHSHCPF